MATRSSTTATGLRKPHCGLTATGPPPPSITGTPARPLPTAQDQIVRPDLQGTASEERVDGALA